MSTSSEIIAVSDYDPLDLFLREFANDFPDVNLIRKETTCVPLDPMPDDEDRPILPRHFHIHAVGTQGNGFSRKRVMVDADVDIDTRTVSTLTLMPAT
jgi:hypothetical protein